MINKNLFIKLQYSKDVQAIQLWNNPTKNYVELKSASSVKDFNKIIFENWNYLIAKMRAGLKQSEKLSKCEVK